MAKKSTAARQAHAARRSQTTSKAPEVTLVRQPKSGDVDVVPAKAAPSGSDVVARPVKTGTAAITPAAAPKRVPAVTRPTAAPVTAKPVENRARPASRAQIDRVTRSQAAQRARLATQLSPRNYAYVRDDLRLIAILAGSMFLLIIILHFLLPLWLPQ